MKIEFRIKSLLVAGLVLGLAATTQAVTAADDNPNKDVQKFRSDCMESLGNEPFCACMAKVLNEHVPKEHLSHNPGGELEFHEDMPREAHNNATKGAAECQEKFRSEAAESS